MNKLKGSESVFSSTGDELAPDWLRGPDLLLVEVIIRRSRDAVVRSGNKQQYKHLSVSVSAP